MSAHTLLVGDIGGTNARFALADPVRAGFSREHSLKCADFATIDQAIRHYLKLVETPTPQQICLAVAGPVEKQQARLTNNPWNISAPILSRQFSAAKVQLINDFTAIAYAIPFLKQQDCLAIGPSVPGKTPSENQTIGIIGPGTGLGASGLFRRNGYHFPIDSEAGHIGFAAETDQQVDLLAALRKRYPRVSCERLLSGSGLENIHWAMSRISDENYAPLDAAEIFHLASNRPESLADRSVQLFFEILGQFSGDLALALGAVDGIYIAGGIVKRYPDLLAESRFREAFDNKGRHKGYMEGISTQLVLHPHPGLLGASSRLLESTKD